MPSTVEIDGRRSLNRLSRISLSTLGRLVEELPTGLRPAVMAQLEAFTPTQGRPLRGEAFAVNYGMQEMPVHMAVAALMLVKSAAHLQVIDDRAAGLAANICKSARLDVAHRCIQDSKMSLASFEGDFAFCEPVAGHTGVYAEVQALREMSKARQLGPAVKDPGEEPGAIWHAHSRITAARHVWRSNCNQPSILPAGWLCPASLARPAA
jgi:hypothetical protein